MIDLELWEQQTKEWLASCAHVATMRVTGRTSTAGFPPHPGVPIMRGYAIGRRHGWLAGVEYGKAIGDANGFARGRYSGYREAKANHATLFGADGSKAIVMDLDAFNRLDLPSRPLKVDDLDRASDALRYDAPYHRPIFGEWRTIF